MGARYTEAHDDMKGQIRSAIAGGTTWDVEVVTGGVFVIGALRNNSSDMFQLLIQVPHWSKLQSLVADLHVHYLLQAASTSGETIVWNTSYAWIKPGEALPATLNALTPVTQVLGTHPVRYYDIVSIATASEIAPPTTETYGSMLFVICTRGNGTHTGKIAILDADSHRTTDRKGSVTPYTD